MSCAGLVAMPASPTAMNPSAVAAILNDSRPSKRMGTHEVAPGASVIREVDRFVKQVGKVGHGTRIADSIRATLRGHDRVFVISDMQTFPSAHGTVTDVVPPMTPFYGFNLGGYRRTAFDAGAPNRIEFGGLTDATFRMIPLIEAGRNGGWPF